MKLDTLSVNELIERVEQVKERALSDSFATSQEFDVGIIESQNSSDMYDDTEAVLDEVVRRLKEGRLVSA